MPEKTGHAKKQNSKAADEFTMRLKIHKCNLFH